MDGQYQARLRLVPMTFEDVEAVHLLECSVFPHPWSRANFSDSLRAGYDAWLLRDADGTLLGYFLLMLAVDEAHLLDVAVAGAHQRSGLGRHLLTLLCERARTLGANAVLLEVRPSNLRALQVYERFGFTEIGRRKAYYPAHEGRREDAIVMRCTL